MVYTEVFTWSWSMCDSVMPKEESTCFQRETDATCEVAATCSLSSPVASGEGGSRYPEPHTRNRKSRREDQGQEEDEER